MFNKLAAIIQFEENISRKNSDPETVGVSLLCWLYPG